MDIQCNRGGVWTWRQRLERSGMLCVEIHAILLHTLPLLQTSSLLSGLNGVLDFEGFLEPETIIPASPNFVVVVRFPRGGGTRGDGFPVRNLFIGSGEDV